MRPTAASPALDYVLPLKWSDDGDLAELTAYLSWLVGLAHVIVVDGSDDELFAAHAGAWSRLVQHVRPDDLGYLYGKVNGVHTGVRLATAERMVIADDDVRYDAESLQRVVALLEGADLVGPQNVFDPMPWHAAWDTSRTLLNRAFAADYPGTFALRRSTFLAMGGYNGDVMFENLELMRTVRAAGGRLVRPLDLYVPRRPPTVRWFLSQRVRQAFDDLAQPWRTLSFLAAGPTAVRVLRTRGPRPLAVAAAAVVVVAEFGRRRGNGRLVFPARTSLWAPLWVVERAICSWLALGQRLRGGVRYRGQRLPIAAHSTRALRRNLHSSALVAAGCAKAGDDVTSVAERLERRAAAAAERDRRPPGIDLAAVGVEEADIAAQDQRAVAVERDRRPVVGQQIRQVVE